MQITRGANVQKRGGQGKVHESGNYSTQGRRNEFEGTFVTGSTIKEGRGGWE